MSLSAHRADEEHKTLVALRSAFFSRSLLWLVVSFVCPSSGLVFFSETFPSHFPSRPVVETEASDGAWSPAAPRPQQNTY